MSVIVVLIVAFDTVFR